MTLPELLDKLAKLCDEYEGPEKDKMVGLMVSVPADGIDIVYSWDGKIMMSCNPVPKNHD